MRSDYINLYKRYFLVNLKSVMIYDLDYFLGIIAMILKSLVNFCMVLLLFGLVDEINGWNFDEDGWGDLIFGIIILAIAVIRLKIFSWKLLLLPVFSICGCLVFAAITILFSSVAFYTTGNIDLTDNVNDFREIIKYPMEIYNVFLRMIFTFLVPVAFISYYPTVWILEKATGIIPCAVIYGVVVSILFFVLAWWFWHRALSRYNSSGH